MRDQHLWYLGDLIPFIPSWIDKTGETSFKPPQQNQGKFYGEMLFACLVFLFSFFSSFLSFFFHLPNLYSCQREEIVSSVHCSLGSDTRASLCASESVGLLFSFTMGKMKGDFFLVLLSVSVHPTWTRAHGWSRPSVSPQLEWESSRGTVQN